MWNDFVLASWQLIFFMCQSFCCPFFCVSVMHIFLWLRVVFFHHNGLLVKWTVISNNQHFYYSRWMWECERDNWWVFVFFLYITSIFNKILTTKTLSDSLAEVSCCDTIQDAILKCARKPTWVRLIYHTVVSLNITSNTQLLVCGHWTMWLWLQNKITVMGKPLITVHAH